MGHCNHWLKRVCAGILACVGLAVIAADPVVSNVRASQRTGTSLLDITYDLADADSDNLTVTVAISTNNGVTWFEPASSNLTGAVGVFAVSLGIGKTIVWQGFRELPARLFPFIKAKITADDTAPLYMSINLSGGTAATSYPVTYYATSNSVPGSVNSDAYKTTNLLLRMIPKGSFTMGSPTGEIGREIGNGTVETQHAVTLTKAFYIGVFEVTQRQWELVMGNRPSFFTNATYYASRPVERVSYYDIREKQDNSHDPNVNWPSNSVVNVDSFMGKLRAKTGLATFDLPTESQWEYACRSGTTKALNTGTDLNNISYDVNLDAAGRYNYNGGSGGVNARNVDTSAGTAKVGSYSPNAWGLYDMHGNAMEWCLDWCDAYPSTVSDPLGANSGYGRVGRSGGWCLAACHCRSADRGSYSPDYRSTEFYGLGGFRVTWIQP